MTIRIYNTLSRTKEELRPVQPGKVGIYLCGPTVYDRAHIGHMVGPVIFDTIKRYLVYCGYDVSWVVNITDVDDKLIAKAQQRGLSMEQIAQENTADYLSNLAGLGVDQIDAMPKATESMDQIIEFTQSLLDTGYAYEVDGDVFFDVTKDAEYGKLTNRTVDSLQGAGGEAAAKKQSPADFALWKRARPDEPSWPSPWGPGRPGWHIECSAMSRQLLGPTFDIHGGGLDLVFPHHENEIAQSECCHGQPMARYWMHNGLLKRAAAGKVGGRSERSRQPADTDDTLERIQRATAEKESRSAGAGGLAALIERVGGETVRFFLLRTHYRSTVLFSEEALAEAATSLETFYRYFERYQRVTGERFHGLAAARLRSEGTLASADNDLLGTAAQCRTAFLDKMDDDFNTGAAVSELFELVRALNRFVDQRKLENAAARSPDDVDVLRQATSTLRELSRLLGLFLQPVDSRPADACDGQLASQLMDLLIDLRASARKNKDFPTADRIRDALARIGVLLEDRPDGTAWRLE